MPHHRPQLVGKVLLHERQLGLHGEHEIGEAWVRHVRSDAREHPAAALLVHEPASAVDRIDDHEEARASRITAVR